jgi:hypothetical protein
MTKQELKDEGVYTKQIKLPLSHFIGRFGTIIAGEFGFKRTMSGYIKEMDTAGNIYFTDNEGYSYIFTTEQIDSFEPKEFVIIKETPKDIMATKKKTPKVNLEQQYKVFFTQNDVEDYFIIEGETAEKARNTALSVLQQRGLDYTANKVHSKRIR